jgi:hypothetical protein
LVTKSGSRLTFQVVVACQRMSASRSARRTVSGGDRQAVLLDQVVRELGQAPRGERLAQR